MSLVLTFCLIEYVYFTDQSYLCNMYCVSSPLSQSTDDSTSCLLKYTLKLRVSYCMIHALLMSLVEIRGDITLIV